MEEYKLIINTIRSGFVMADGKRVRPNTKVANCLILGAQMGLRVGDITRLKLNDIVQEGGQYRLNYFEEQKTKKTRHFIVPKEVYIFLQQYALDEEIKDILKTPKSKEVLSVTKSEYGVRTLPLSDIAVEALIEWEKRLRRSRNKNKANSTFIFPTRTGQFRSESSCESMLQRFRKKYDLEDMEITYYKFRHTMCTRLILAGQPIPVIQRILGDNTPDVITKIYTHVNEQMALQSAKGFYDDMNRRHTEMAS